MVEQLNDEFQQNLPADKASAVIEFARQSYAGATLSYFAGRQIADVSAATLGSWGFLQQHNPATPKVRLFNPVYKKHGWQLSRSVIVLLARNKPFITDSIRGELNRRNLTVHNLSSVIYSLHRDQQHQLVSLLPSRSTKAAPDGCYASEEALLYIEIGRCTDSAEQLDIVRTLQSILVEVNVVVDDFAAMSQQAQSLIAQLSDPASNVTEQQTEAAAMLQWLVDGQFTFLAYEQLEVDYQSQQPQVSRVEHSELGLLKLRPSKGSSELYNAIQAGGINQLAAAEPLLVIKSSIRSRVHRLVYPDYVVLRCFDSEGRVVAKHRFLGLFTSKVYTQSPSEIPVIRGKVAAVLERSGLDLKDHQGKDLGRLLEVFPRDELFQSSVDELYSTSMAVNEIQERRQVRLFVRRDNYRKFVNCLVYIPRDIYRTEIRLKIEQLLCSAFGAVESEFTTYFSDSILTRSHFLLRVDPSQLIDVDSQQLEEEVVHVTMSWKEHFNNNLLDEFGDEEAAKLFDQYGDAFGPGYMDDFESRAAIDDIKKIATLTSVDDIAMSFYRKQGSDEQSLCFRLLHRDTPLALSDVMPILENLGLRVESEHPYDVDRKDGQRIWVHEYSVLYGLSATIDFNKVEDIFQQAFLRIWQGDAESDSFNKLILGAGLGWRQIAMLRAYERYMKQIQFSLSSDYIAETLCKHLNITASIVELFERRFSCDFDGTEVEREQRESDLRGAIVKALDGVENLNEDRIIQHYIALIEATQRTNYYQQDTAGNVKNYFSFKLRPALIPDMPLPVPMFEIFVYSPRVEGVHLRGGKVARGGLRWSDRHEDFRTEVLGLVKAQQVKNSVIVPMGAKGGFVAKQMSGKSGRDEIQQEGISCYKIFIQALLDVTDNLVEGEVVPPSKVVRKDEDDTYLVVAADKGTATFSDIANELSIKAGFWMGDAFASGGSAGYDHKKMGITAKGAWVSVQRHFRELNTNIQDTDFSVVAIGDMAGDVFGNGMLLSEHIQLVCAFNHMHIFVDPNPDAAASFIERKRLFELPRSSWEDYKTELISQGGAIFSRTAKYLDLSPETKKRFAIEQDRITPNEFIHAALKAPVDLFWNGGIGTYVKASTETHAEVGDKANDVLRVDAKDLQCRVIGEGGNLGITQLARVEFALHGGHSNTDFIDNAAGVDCSDHEVNIKILLNEVVASNDMTEKQRNQLLEQMTEEVSELVLENNYRQTQALSLAEREAHLRSGEYRRLIHAMEASGKLNRQMEFIPDDDVMVERRAAGKGLTRPELSVLISYVKSQLKEQLAASNVPDNEYLAAAVETAFPQRLRDDFNGLIHNHRLRREIIATQLANDMVNYMGITFVDRMVQSTGAEISDIVRAYISARDVFDMPTLWAQIEALDYQVDAEVQMQLMAELLRLVRRASRWFIRNRRESIEPAQQIASFQQSVTELREQLPALLTGELKEARHKKCQHYLELGVPKELASCIASAGELYPFLGIIEASHSMDKPASKVAELYFNLADQLGLDWFARKISELKVDNYWQAMARETYRDDLEFQLRTITQGAMRYMDDSSDVTVCIDSWRSHQQILVDRWRTLLAELQGMQVHEFAMYSVAIRELLDLAQSSKYSAVD
ncbi:MAG: glutamate dehydrogenase [Oceanicoccus sp.]|jgi:glutamate dehydrogenase